MGRSPWASLSLTLGPMSKMVRYQKRGYLASGMVNYLSQLGWNDGTKQEIYSTEELLSAFKMERMSKVRGASEGLGACAGGGDF